MKKEAHPLTVTKPELRKRGFTVQLVRFVRTVWADVQQDGCIDLAAQMSFYFVLSLFPFLIVIGSLVGWLPSTDLWHQMAQWLTHYLPPRSRSIVFVAILDLTQHNLQFFSYGLVAMFWIASSGFVSLMESLSLAYGFPETRGFWKKRIIAICATIVGTVFTIVSFGFLTLGHFVAEALAPHLSQVLPFAILLGFGRWFVTLLLMLLGLDLMNYFLPNVNLKWHWLTRGTIFDVLGFLLMSAGFNLYLEHFGNYPMIYGTMAGFVILVTWIYLASLILLVGAKIDSVATRLQQHGAMA